MKLFAFVLVLDYSLFSFQVINQDSWVLLLLHWLAWCRWSKFEFEVIHHSAVMKSHGGRKGWREGSERKREVEPWRFCPYWTDVRESSAAQWIIGSSIQWSQEQLDGLAVVNVTAVAVIDGYPYAPPLRNRIHTLSTVQSNDHRVRPPRWFVKQLIINLVQVFPLSFLENILQYLNKENS